MQKRRIEKAVKEILLAIGEDPTRQDLVDTPRRVAKMYEEIFSGIKQEPKKELEVLLGESHNEIVLLKGISLYSMCEHHMVPFYGKAHIAYLPDKKLVGISKLARLLEIYSRRLQIQERIGEQVVDAIIQHLRPKGTACIIEATHLCMKMRGVEKQNSVMKTSSMRGVFLEDAGARQELFNLISL